MNVRVSVVGTASFLLLAGCGGGSGDIEPRLISQSDTATEAVEKVEAFADESIFPVFDSEGVTLFDDLPESGGVTYTGFIGGLADASDTQPINYVANLSLTFNFQSDGISGRAYDYVTDVDGFETPSGDVELTGFIDNNLGNAAVFFSGSGVLTGDSVNAEVFTDADGFFGGADPKVVAGDQITDFEWGDPLFGTSTSDGGWAAAN